MMICNPSHLYFFVVLSALIVIPDLIGNPDSLF